MRRPSNSLRMIPCFAIAICIAQWTQSPSCFGRPQDGQAPDATSRGQAAGANDGAADGSTRLSGAENRAIDSGAESTGQTRSFRPILIPDERKAELVRDMVPIRKDLFLEKWRRLQLANRAKPIEARIKSAVYRANLEGDTWIDGEAQLKVESIRADSPAMLPLGRISLALSNARFVDEQFNPPEWGAAPDGNSWLSVEGRGEFLIDWSFRGVRNAVGETEFEFELPASLNTTLELTAPAGVELRSDAGIVRRQAIDTSGGDSPVLWTIDIGGKQRFSVFSVDASQPRQRQLGVVQKAEYRLGRVSLEANIDLQVRVRGGPLSTLDLIADPRLVLISAKLGDEFLADESIQQLDQEGGERKWRINLPRPLRGQAGSIQLRAFSRLPLDESWSLPQIRVDANEWSATEVALELAPELELRRFEARQSHHHNVTRTAQGNLRLQFQHCQAAGEIDLVVGERRFDPSVESGLHLQLNPERIAAKLTADISTWQGELYALTVNPAPGWRILSVGTEPPEALMRDEFEWQSDSPFTVPFATPASKENPVRLLIDAVRDYPQSTKRIQIGESQVASFPGIASETRLIRVTGGENAQAVLSGDIEVARLAPGDLGEKQTQRLGGTEGVLFDGGSRAMQAIASLRRQDASFDVAVKTTIDVEEQRTRETYRATFTPNAMSLNEVVVRFNRGRASDVAWSIFGRPNGIVTSVREALADGDSGEQWRITLRQTMDEPFELIGQRDSSSGATVNEAALIDVVGAATQLSKIVVRSSDKTPLGLTPTGLEPSTIPPTSPGQYSLAQAAYRHESARTASLRIERLQGVAPGCWVWRMNTYASLEKNGVVGYQSVIQLENSGRSALSIGVPDNTIDWLVYVDDLEAAALKSGNTISVPLPDRRLRPTVVLRYRTRSRPIRWLGEVKLSAPKLDMAVLRRDWTVLLPPGFAEWPSGASWDWRERIFAGAPSRLLDSLRREQQRIRSYLLSQEEQPAIDSLAETLVQQPASFSELARNWSRRLNGLNQRVLVDSQSLAVATILPESLLPAQPQTMSSNEAGQWLERRGLMLRKTDGVWVLHAEAADDTGRGSTSAALTPLADWGRKTEGEQQVWDVSVTAPATRSNRRQLRFAETIEVTTSIYNRSTFAAWEWCAACIALALTLRVASRSYSLAIAAAMVLVALTLWAPPHLVFSTRGALFGVAAAAAVRTIVRRYKPAEPPVDESESDSDSVTTRTASAVATASAVIAGLLIWAYASQSNGQQPESGNDVDRFGLPGDQPNVLIPAVPAGEKLEPFGDFCYVSPSLYRQLMEANSAEGGTGLNWLVRDAAYTMQVERQALSEVNVRMTISVRRAGAIVAPFPGPLVRSAFWDGRPVTFQSNESSVEFYASDLGLHELELVLEPELTDGAEPNYTIPAPPTSNATLTLNGTEKLSGIRSPSVRGSVRRLDVDRWTAQLGRVDRVEIGWQGLGQPADVRELEVDELYWLRVRPKSVSVEAQLQLRPLRNDVRQFSMLAEPDLQLLNIGREQGVESHESVAASDDWVLHRFVLEEPIEDERTVRLSFLWKGMGGVGRIPAPRLKVDARYVRDQRMALSVAQPLLWDLSRDDQWESLAPAEFASAWGDEGAPLSAFRAPRDEAPWMLHTRYPESTSTAQGEMVVVVENRKLICELSATFRASTTDRYQHRVLAPKNFRLTSASLIEDDRERPIQARLDQDGQLALFSEKPIASEHQLRLVGEIDRQGNRFELPTFGILDGQLTIDSVRVYRRPDVGPLRWIEFSGFDKTMPMGGGFSARHGRLEAVLLRNERPRKVAIQSSSRRRAAAQGVGVTSLTREQGQWIATSSFRVRVGKGSPMDVLRFEVPAEWTDLKLDPAWPFRMAPLPNANRKHLLVYPPSPIDNSAHLTIRGALSTAGEDRLRHAPEITPLDLRSAERYFVLPMRLENQRYVWEISGREKEPPAGLKPTLPEEGEYQSILAVGNSRATVQIVRQLAGDLKIQSADYRLRWRNKDEAYGVAQFDVDATGSQFCMLSAPVNVELLRVAVDGIEHHMVDSTRRGIAIRLGPEQLPQRISVVFVVRNAAEGFQQAPFLSDDRNNLLPCERTLWTIDAADQRSLKLTAVDSDAIHDETTHDLARLRLAVNMMQTVSARDTGATQDDLGVWFSTWASRVAQLQERLRKAAQRTDVASGELRSARGDEIRQAVEASEAIKEASAKRFSATTIRAIDSTDEISSAWELESAASTQHFHAGYADTQRAAIPVFAGTPESPSPAPHWLLAGFLLIAAIPILGAPALRAPREWFAAWPQTVLAAIGLIWWACGPLPWIGLGLALLMLASSLDSSWQATRR